MAVSIVKNVIKVGIKGYDELLSFYLEYIVAWKEQGVYNTNELLIILGSSLGNIALNDLELVDNSSYTEIISYLKSYLKEYNLNCSGLVFTNACLSSMCALHASDIYITNQIYKQIIILTYDFSNALINNGLSSMNILSNNNSFTPFSEEQDGIVVQSSAGIMLIGENDINKPIILDSFINNDSEGITSISRGYKGLKKCIVDFKNKYGDNCSIDYFVCSLNGLKIIEEAYKNVIYDFWDTKSIICSLKTSHFLGTSTLIEISEFLNTIKTDNPNSKIYFLNGCKKSCLKSARVMFLCIGFGGINGILIMELNENEILF